MADVLFVAIVVVFFAICVAYVSWCDRLVGPDPSADRSPADEAMTERAEVM